MIFGDCPYCGDLINMACPEQTPCWGKVNCGSCGREFWEHYSRIDPKAFTVEEFEARFIVDEESGRIKERPLSEFDQAIMDGFRDSLYRLLQDELINSATMLQPFGRLGKSPTPSKKHVEPS